MTINTLIYGVVSTALALRYFLTFAALHDFASKNKNL